MLQRIKLYFTNYIVPDDVYISALMLTSQQITPN